MKFTYEGHTYGIEFEREYRTLELRRGSGTKKRIVKVRSTYPYTIAKLLGIKQGELPQLLAKASVGCLPIDKFENEVGRRQALRALCVKIAKAGATKELRSKLFTTYFNRKNESQPAVEVTASAVLLPGLPPVPDNVVGFYGRGN